MQSKWDKAFWARGYYVETIGNITDEAVQNFYTSTPVNATQRRRGNMMDVVTIWRPDEINNIGHTLLKVINGTYASEEDK